MSTLLLLALAGGVGRVVLLLVFPMRKCKVVSRAGRRQVRGCAGCGWRGKHVRFGAVTVHRWRRLVIEELKERRQR